jgi:hypothetical protein
MAAAVPLLIQVGVAAGASLASKFLAPKPKLTPVDKGRFDDIRFQTAEEGAFIPLCFGQRVRLAGNMIWGTKTKEYLTSTPGRSGGKGGTPQTPTPPTNTFTYKKSFALLVCATPVRSYRRISENLDVVYNNVGSELQEGFYEAENHNAGGGANVIVDGQCSGGRAVRLAGSGQYVEFNVTAEQDGLYSVVIFYKAASSATVYLSANGGSESVVSLPEAATVPLTVTASLQLVRGANTIRIRRGSGTTDVDRIYISATGSLPTPPPGDVPDPPIGPRKPDRAATHLIDPGATFPTDPDNPQPYYNAVQGFDSDGYFEGYLTAGGQARFELFAGRETQPQSAIIVAVEGADETPAWRDASFFAAEDYLVQNGQLGNFIFEIEPDIQYLDETLLYLYTLDGKVTADDCDFSALAGTVIPGLILDRRAPLQEWVTALETWFNFDTVPRGGKITAVPRGGSAVTRLYERELRAHLYGDQRPVAAVSITHTDPVDLPGMVDVIYLDPSPSKDFHTGNQPAELTVGFAFDKDTISFPIVGDADTAHAVGLRYLDAKQLEAKPATIVCSTGNRYLIPSDVIEVELDNGTLYTFRITQKQADLQGMVKFGVVPERASLYSQKGAGVSGRGGDQIIVRPPANTLLVVADTVPLRQADLGKLLLYRAACPRGSGSWPGYFLNKRDRNGEVELIGGFQTPATIGVIQSASQSAANSGFEPTREFVVKLYYGSLESRTEADVRGERVNLALYGAGSRFEVLQFLTVESQMPTAPFVAQYKVTGTFSGLFGTEGNSSTHADGDFFLLFDAAVGSFPMQPADISLPFDFIAQTAGQALADAEAISTYSLTVAGNSVNAPAPARVETDPDTGLAPRDANGNLFVQLWPRSNEFLGDEYLIDYLSDDRSQTLYSVPFREGDAAPGMLIGSFTNLSGKFANVTGTIFGDSFALSGSLKSGQGRALQLIRAEGNFVEALLAGSGDYDVKIGLLSSGRDWRTATPDYFFYLSGGGAGQSLTANDPSGVLYTEDPTAYASAGKRFRIVLRGRRVEFYKDFQNDGSQPLAVSGVAPNFPLLAVVVIAVGSSGSAQASGVRITTNPLPQTILTAAEQVRYYGGLKSPVQVRIRQHSGVREIGYGPAWEGAI